MRRMGASGTLARFVFDPASPAAAAAARVPGDDLAQQDEFARVLRACSKSKDLLRGRQAHSQILASTQRHSRYLSNLLIEMYGNCGAIADARGVFDWIPFPNVFSWNMMIAAYIHNDQLNTAGDLFAAAPQRDVVSWTTMIAANAQRGHLDRAREFFDKMPGRNLVSWNAMIAGYVQNARDQEAVELFRRMDQEGASPNHFTIASIIDAFGNLGDLASGEFAHRRAVDRGDDHDVIILTALIIMYGKLGKAREAERVYGRAPAGDLVALSAMIGAFAQCGEIDSAKRLFDRVPNRDVVVWTGMISALAQSGNLEEARQLFAAMPIKNAVSWSAIIAANAQHGQGKEAVRLFKLMDLEGEFPHQFTIGSLIDACSADPSLAEARIIHSVIRDNGFKLDVVLSSALINMYGKCGRLDLAREVFEAMEQRNIVSWNTIIANYAESGHGDEALFLFFCLHLEGLRPDDLTISSALSACCHSGLLEDARFFFLLSHEYGIHLSLDNYSCMIFLLGKAGRLGDAEELICTMPFEPREITWMTLLSACKTHRDVNRGSKIGQVILGHDPDESGPYVLLSNVYT